MNKNLIKLLIYNFELMLSIKVKYSQKQNCLLSSYYKPNKIEKIMKTRIIN